METRIIVAYALLATMLVGAAIFGARYVYRRRQFKIRQMGRGKNINS